VRIGVVVNPIAGMGGRVGLKGTDGKVAEARARGAKPRAPGRLREALESLAIHDPDTTILTYADPMGEREVRAAGFDPVVVGAPEGEQTTAADTRAATASFLDAGVDLVLFVGGDGTAVDVAGAIDDAGVDVPMLGVPAGVKVYSAVFAVTPEAAGQVAANVEAAEDADIVDVDEDAFRGGDVITDLKAVASVPVAEERQSAKQIGGGTVEGLAEAVAAELDPGVTYVLGPGSTVGAIKRELGFSGSPLGVDVYRDGEVVVRDASEDDVLVALGADTVVIVSPIGGQGFVFGRGNDQISPAVIERSDVEIVASRRKLDDLGVLRVDTVDPDVDESLRGWHRVRVGRFEHRMMQVQ